MPSTLGRSLYYSPLLLVTPQQPSRGGGACLVYGVGSDARCLHRSNRSGAANPNPGRRGRVDARQGLDGGAGGV